MLRKFIDYAPEYQALDGASYLLFLRPDMHPFSKKLTALKLAPSIDKEQARQAVLRRDSLTALEAFGQLKNFEFGYFKRFIFIIQLTLKWPTLIFILGMFVFGAVMVGLTPEFYLLVALHMPWILPVIFSKISPLPEPAIKNLF